MPKYDEMLVFSAVVKAGSLSAAARTLGRTPSAVSRQLTRLESRVGVALLLRNTRSLSLTEAGHRYYSGATEVLARMDALEEALSDHADAPRGLVRVSIPATVARKHVIPALPRLYVQYPGLRVELCIDDSITNVVTQGIDVAIRFGKLSDSSLVARRLGAFERVAVASPDYIERRGTPEHPSGLQDHDCLCVSYADAVNIWQFEGEHGRIPWHVRGHLFSTTVDCMRAAALAGLGIAWLATCACDQELQEGRLVPLLRKYRCADDPVVVHAVSSAKRHRAPKVQAFIGFCAELFAELTDTCGSIAALNEAHDGS